MSIFCAVFFCKLGANEALLGCFGNWYLSWMCHFGQLFLQQCFEHTAFLIYPHLVDLPVFHYSNQGETWMSLILMFPWHLGLVMFLICWILSIAVWHFDVIWCLKLSCLSSRTPRYLIISATLIFILVMFSDVVMHLSGWGFWTEKNELSFITIQLESVFVHPHLQVYCTFLQFMYTSCFIFMVACLEFIFNSMIIHKSM